MMNPITRNIPALMFAAAVLAATPLAASAAAPDESGAVFECQTRDGRTVFSDEPCVGAPRVRVWSPRVGAPGIEASSPTSARTTAPAQLAAATAGHESERAAPPAYGPYVDCQRRGGRYELAARICRLPDDAARHMFDAR